MRWTPGGRSADLEDRRGEGGGGGGFRLGGGKLGIGGFIILALLSLIFKKNFFALVGGGSGDPGGTVASSTPPPTSPEEEKMIQFVSFVLDDVQGTWRKEFQQQGQSYQNAKLDIFTDAINSGCGSAEAGMGPFYCPIDQKVYIDLNFYEELRKRFGAPGDFAQAYVLAHEVGHHVQHLLGIDGKVREAQERDPSIANELSVAMELQADCFAGVWGHSTQQRQILEEGDVEEALAAASAVGDDRIQKQSTGRVNPETWTHGSARDRAAWFRRGFETGNSDNCDTFASR